MAERIVSPGVFARENDISFLAPAPAEVSTAVIGPTVKGPVDIPTVVRSYSEYVAVFGDRFKSGSQYYQHTTSIAAEKYFEQGGNSLLVGRVAPGSFTAATATIQTKESTATDLFTVATLGEGEIMNTGDTVITNSDNTLTNGSKDNIRLEIADSNDATGYFTLLVRRGDDSDKNRIILETWTNLSMDPTSERYVSKVIGDVVHQNNGGIMTEEGDNPNKSAYIRISNVAQPLPDYFDNSGAVQSAYANKMPAVGNKQFSGATGAIFSSASAGAFFDAISATNSEGLVANAGAVADYDDVISALENTEEFNFNVIVTPGLNNIDHATTVGSVIDMVEKRGDAIYVADMGGYANTRSEVEEEASSLNSSFTATYWPWVKVQAQGVGRQVWVPASTIMPGVFAFNDSVSAEWFAPAGLVRGGIPGVTRAKFKLSRADRDSLYLNKVNPLATFPGQGIVAYGQKTLQTKASALDRVNVRRLLINLKRFIGGQANNLVFEQNTIATRNRFLSAVNPYLDTVVQNEGLYAYRVVMDDTNNTADVVDRNQLVGQIYIQPTKTAEFIVLDFVVQPSGASFGA